MVGEEDSNRGPHISENPSRNRQEIDQKNETMFSPGFRSVAAMAGWDEEALLIASIVEDTPDRQCKQKKRFHLHNLKTPPTNSRRKRRVQRRSPASIPITVLDLEEDEPKTKQESEKMSKYDTSNSSNVNVNNHMVKEDEELNVKTKSSEDSSSTPSIPCLDRLREELSCAVCLEICYEPSTTPCGHSFCKKCLSSAADKCGRKCPKCRQIISTGKYCKINTVLWNTIQLLFPQEVEARKAAADSASESSCKPQPKTRSHHRHITRSRAVEDLCGLDSSDGNRKGAERGRNNERVRSLRREELLRQNRDAAIALRLQREEFRQAFTVPVANERRTSPATARANLRAMASRAINIRIGRGRSD